MCVLASVNLRNQSEMQDSASICGKWGRWVKIAVQSHVNFDTRSPYLNRRAYGFQGEYDIVANDHSLHLSEVSKENSSKFTQQERHGVLGALGRFPVGTLTGDIMSNTSELADLSESEWCSCHSVLGGRQQQKEMCTCSLCLSLPLGEKVFSTYNLKYPQQCQRNKFVLL